ncbi:hypothetical protein [Chryseobacterium luteum]|nr:hypothetical protein [Chryseobacterium luteum]
MNNSGKKEFWIKRIRLIKRYVLGFIIAFSLLLTASVVLFISFKIPSSFVLILSLPLLLMMYFLFRRYFTNYEKMINMLDDNEVAELQNVNDSILKISKYFPSFIITSGKIIVIKAINIFEINIDAITEISFNSFYNRSGRNNVVIIKQNNSSPYSFIISNRLDQQNYLIKKVKGFNPEIIIHYN